jgi:hypothetical protein
MEDHDFVVISCVSVPLLKILSPLNCFCASVILAAQKAEIRRIVEASSGKKFTRPQLNQ